METEPEFLTPAQRARLPLLNGKMRRPSKISVPQNGTHPLGKLVFRAMRDQNVSYDALEHSSGVLRCTVKSYRLENRPGLDTISACLGALGHELVATPDPRMLPAEARAKLAELAPWFSEQESLAAVIVAAAQWPEHARHTVKSRRGEGLLSGATA